MLGRRAFFADMDEHQRREVVVAMRKVTTVSGQIIIKYGLTRSSDSGYA